MLIINEIKTAIDAAGDDKKRTSTFHSLILVHAHELEKIGAVEACRLLGMQDSWRTEFTKMISISKRFAELGYSVERRP
jgi:hypothetical protein